MRVRACVCEFVRVHMASYSLSEKHLVSMPSFQVLTPHNRTCAHVRYAHGQRHQTLDRVCIYACVCVYVCVCLGLCACLAAVFFSYCAYTSL